MLLFCLREWAWARALLFSFVYIHLTAVGTTAIVLVLFFLLTKRNTKIAVVPTYRHICNFVLFILIILLSGIYKNDILCVLLYCWYKKRNI